MPLDIVYEYPAAIGWLRRLMGALVTLLGGLLILAGLAVSILPILYGVATVAALVSSKGRIPAPDAALAISILVMVLSLTIGLWLVRGKRRLVLFLRKFGFIGATQAVTFAVVKALGRNWRLVTLDDAEVAPVGTRKRMRWLAIVAGLIAVGVVAWGLFWVFGGSFDSLMGDTAKGAMKGATLKDFLPKIIVAMVLLIVVGGIALVLILVPVGFAGAVALFAWSSYGAIRRAESAKTVPIATEAQLEQTALAIARRSRRIIGPRLVVTKVASSIWQLAVRRLASASSAVIIDISEPTDNLLWEVESLRPEMRSRCILVGEQDRLRRMAEETAQQGRSPQARLLRLLDGEQVLAYASNQRDLRRFARSLHARLEALRPA
jgi:hypothetical protein